MAIIHVKYHNTYNSDIIENIANNSKKNRFIIQFVEFDDIMNNNSNNGNISEMSTISALLFMRLISLSRE